MHYALGVSHYNCPQGSSGASCAQLSCSSCWDPGQLPGCPPSLLLPYHSHTLPMPGLSIPLLSSDAWLSSSNLFFHPSSGLLHLEIKRGRRNLCSSPAFVTASLLPLKHVAPSGYRTDPELCWVDSQVTRCFTHPHTYTHPLPFHNPWWAMIVS